MELIRKSAAVAKFFSQGGENESIREAKTLVVVHSVFGGVVNA